jgi:hypothetical protein
MRKAVFVLAISALSFAASAQPLAPPAGPDQTAPASVPQVSGLTVQGKVNGLPKEQCKEKDKACIQQVVAALHALTGLEKQKVEIWCMANAMAHMRRSSYYSGDRAPFTERVEGNDPGGGEQAACIYTPDQQAKK